MDLDVENIPEMSEEDKGLLALRQTFQKKSCTLARAKSHLAFVRECKEHGIVPKGLQVPTKCHALMAHHSNVVTAFKDINIRTEEDFLDALMNVWLEPTLIPPKQFCSQQSVVPHSVSMWVYFQPSGLPTGPSGALWELSLAPKVRQHTLPNISIKWLKGFH
jgi:hypothetical protein